MRKQTDLLDHIANVPAQFYRIDLRNVLAIDDDLAFRWVNQAVDHAHCRGLAAARWTYQRRCRPFRYHQREIINEAGPSAQNVWSHVPC